MGLQDMEELDALVSYPQRMIGGNAVESAHSQAGGTLLPSALQRPKLLLIFRYRSCYIPRICVIIDAMSNRISAERATDGRMWAGMSPHGRTRMPAKTGAASDPVGRGCPPSSNPPPRGARRNDGIRPAPAAPCPARRARQATRR